MDKGKKLLIVDDQCGIRLLLEEVFKEDFCETYQAENSRQALAIVSEQKPDVVLLDVKMPGMDGLEILRQMRRMGSDTKVILMTAYSELDIIEEAFKHGVVTYISKPFDIEEIRREVNRHLSDKTNPSVSTAHV